MVDEFRLWLPRQPRPFHEGSSHLTTDGDIEELHAFARSIGCNRGWFQPRFEAPHYDLTLARRSVATSMGAVFVPAKEQAHQRLAARRTP